MANRYWVGGGGNWSDAANHWATTSGGTPNAANLPTASDNAIFDANSTLTKTTVTIDATSRASPNQCLDFNANAITDTLTLQFNKTSAASSYFLDVYGNWTNSSFLAFDSKRVASVFNYITFKSTSTGKTITTNGVSFSELIIGFDGVGGDWTLVGALTISGTNRIINFTNGTFNTGNYALTCGQITLNPGTKTANFGSSTITLAGATVIDFSTDQTGFTFNPGTSQINCTAASVTFTGGDLTYANVAFTSTAVNTLTINGSNIYNNFSVTARAAAGTGQLIFDAGGTNTINGTLTLGSGTTGAARLSVASDVLGTATTLSVANLAVITDIDFRDVIASGASAPWSGTRIGDASGNSNITGATPRTVYWNSPSSNNWSLAVWSTTSGNTGGTTTAFPLAQDTIVIDDAGLGTGNTITFNVGYFLPSINFSTRTNPATLSTLTFSPRTSGNMTLSPAVTMSSTAGTTNFSFYQKSNTIILTSAGVGLSHGVLTYANTLAINGNLILSNTFSTFTLQRGILDLTNENTGNYTITTGLFNSNNTNQRSIKFGTGNITLTGSNTTIWTTATATNFSYTGTPTVNATYSGSTGTRTLSNGSTAGGTEANALSFNISAGSDIVLFNGASTSAYKNINFTGFTGTLSAPTAVNNIYGNLIISSGMTVGSGTGTFQFSATSGTQQITTNSVLVDRPITQNSPGATVQLQDNLTMGSTRTIRLISGTLNANNKNVTAGLVSTNGDVARTLIMGNGTWTLTGTGTTWSSGSTPTNMNFIANSSTILINGTGAAITFQGAGYTYNNLTVSSNTTNDIARTLSLDGTNTTFNNLTIGPMTVLGRKTIFIAGPDESFNINGTFTCNTSSILNRIFIFPGTTSNTTSITANNVLLSNTIFRGYTALGNSIPWTGTNLGDAGNNRNINFNLGKTVYWSNTSGGDWYSNSWAATSGGTPDINYFPLSQDTVIFDNAGLSPSANIFLSANVDIDVGSIDSLSLTNPTTLYLNGNGVDLSGNLNLNSAVTFPNYNSGYIYFNGLNSYINSPGATITANVYFQNMSSNGSTTLLDNVNIAGFTNLQFNTINLNNKILSTNNFVSTRTNSRRIDFGNSGAINLTGNSSFIFDMSIANNFTYTGTPTINATYSGSTGQRLMYFGYTSGGTQFNCPNFNITNGSDQIFFPGGGSNVLGNVDFSGFSGSLATNTNILNFYGNLKLSNTMIIRGGSTLNFAATNATRTITSNGVLIGRPVAFNGVGGTWQLQDNLTLQSSNTVTLTNGTIDLNSKNLTCGQFTSVTSNPRSILFGIGNINLANNNTTLWSMSTADNFTYIGTPNVNLTYSGSTGTRSISFGGTSGGTINNALNFNVNSGNDAIAFGHFAKNLNLNGFSGNVTIGISNTKNIIYENLTFSNSTSLLFRSNSVSTIKTINPIDTTTKTVSSTIPGSQYVIQSLNGTNFNTSNLTITDCISYPSNTWYALTTNGNVDNGNNLGITFNPRTLSTLTRTYSNGDFLIAAGTQFDEVTGSINRYDNYGLIAAKEFDEVTSISPAKARIANTGTFTIAGTFNEVDGIPQ